MKDRERASRERSTSDEAFIATQDKRRLAFTVFGWDILHVESMFKIMILAAYVRSETLDFLYQCTDMVQWTLAALDTGSEEVEFPHVLYP